MLLAAIAAARGALSEARGGDCAKPCFRLQHAAVAPDEVFLDGRRRVTLRYRFRATRAVGLKVAVIKRGSARVVAGGVLRRARPGRTRAWRWDGLEWDGEAADGGRYGLWIGRRGFPLHRAGRFRLRDHIHPVRGPHGDRGGSGEFGAIRAGGRRTHEGFDVTAACGTPLVAARGGRVLRNDYDPILYGYFVLIDGRKTARNYFYSHLIRPAAVREGRRVRTGRRIGAVGKTGNARTVGCHLHFEMRVRGVPFDPEPELRRWDRYS